MDWLAFIAAMADALAWPLVVVLLFWVLRRPLLALLPQVTRLRYKELEADFGRAVAEVEAHVAQALPDSAAARLPAPDGREARLAALASVAPGAAVMEAWREVEAAAKRLIAREQLQPDYQVPTPYRLIEQILQHARLLETRHVKLFRELRLLRNKVAHAPDFDPTAEQAVEYVHAACALARFIEARVQAADAGVGD